MAEKLNQEKIIGDYGVTLMEDDEGKISVQVVGPPRAHNTSVDIIFFAKTAQSHARGTHMFAARLLLVAKKNDKPNASGPAPKAIGRSPKFSDERGTNIPTPSAHQFNKAMPHGFDFTVREN
jgi:hypothetical protein